MTTATAPAPAISREILEDRWAGWFEKTPDGQMTRDALRLANALGSAVGTVARREDVQDLKGGLGQLEGELCELIHRYIVDTIDERGLAR